MLSCHDRRERVKGWREKEMEGNSWREDKEDSGHSRGLKGEEFSLSSDLQKRMICQVYLDD